MSYDKDYDDAETITGLRRSDLRKLVANERIPHVRVGERSVRFDASELTAWLEAQRRGPRKESA